MGSWGQVNTVLEEGTAVYPQRDAVAVPAQDELSVEPVSYTDIINEYVADVAEQLRELPENTSEYVSGRSDALMEYANELWDAVLEEYTDHELSGYDRLQDAVAESVVQYSPDIENPYAEAVAESTVEFGRSFGQAIAGALTTPSAIYDTVQGLKGADDHPISPYVQMEEYRDGDSSMAEVAGKAVGFVAGAALAVQYPFVMLAGAAQSGRHFAERKAHQYLCGRVQRVAEIEEHIERTEEDVLEAAYTSGVEAATKAFEQTIEEQEVVVSPERMVRGTPEREQVAI